MLPPVADRFVAGETAPEALEHARGLQRDGRGAILNLLGEHYDERAPAEADAAAYRELVDEIAAADLRACISVKPSQLGLDLGESTFRELLDDVAAHAAAADVRCWLDMEDHETTDATLDAAVELGREHGGGVGVCLQANLKRTGGDVARLADEPVAVRLVKGAYDEPAAIAYRDRDAVDRAFRELMATLFETYDDGEVAIATHDPAMIDRAKRLHDEHETAFEFQLLMGVREDAQRELAREYEVWQYVPYGSRWFSYFSRRVAERRENLGFALRAVAGAFR